MKILIIGEGERAAELVKYISPAHEVTVRDIANQISEFEVIFDINADEEDYTFNYLPNSQLLIVSAVKKTLNQISVGINNYPNMVGMNLLPAFINRSKMEVSFPANKPIEAFDNFAASNKWEYKRVNDAIGMVTPRVLSMIINEAAYTLQEGTASREDIDKGMMLGTNYPIGPLAWCDKIGVNHVVSLLQSLYKSTGDTRYKVCTLLLEINKKKEKFY